MIKKLIFANCITFLLLFIGFRAAASTGCVVAGGLMYTRALGGTAAATTQCPGATIYDGVGGISTPKNVSASCFSPSTTRCFVTMTRSNNAGACGTVRTEINCPLDSNVFILLALTATTAVFFFRKNHYFKPAI